MKVLNEQARKVGQEAYALMNDHDRALIAFGMFPKDKMDTTEEGFKRKLSLDLIKKQYCIDDPSDDLIKEISDSIYPDIINDMMKNFTVGLMDSAKKAGKMIA